MSLPVVQRWGFLLLVLVTSALCRTAICEQPPQNRMKLTFSGYDRPEVLTDFPVLVRLSEELPNFFYAQFASTEGRDLRFYDSTETVELPYEVESWSTSGVSLVWVNLSALAGSNDFIWAHWGDPANSTSPAYTTNGAVWAFDYRLVMHMASATDSSTNELSGVTSNITWAASHIGNAAWFNGSNSLIQKPAVAVLQPPTHITMSAWVNPADLTSLAYREIYRKDDGASRQLFSFQASGTILSFGLGVANAYGELDVTINEADYTNAWHLVTAVYDGTRKYVYRDGVEIGSTETNGAISTTNSVPAFLGCKGGVYEWFDGGIDEMRISGFAYSSNRVWATWENQRTGSSFITYEMTPTLETAPVALSFDATYAGANPPAQSFVVTNLGPLAATYANTVSYDPGGEGWLTIDPSPGYCPGFAWSAHTGSVSIAGLDAGTYTATNVLLSVPSMAPLCHVVVTLSVAKASQTITFPAIPGQLTTNAYGLSASASSALPVSFAVASGPATISGGTNLSFSATGTVAIVASQPGNVNWHPAPPVTNTFEVTAAQLHPRRMKITFSGYTKQDVLTNFPALVVLSQARPDFLYNQFVSPAGHDLRFYDAAGTTELAYEIETWNPSGESFVWVNVPRLSGSNDSIWACWGDETRANQPTYATNGATWAADYRLVMHMGSALDSSTNVLTGTAGTDVVFTNGRISTYCYFNGTSSRIRKDHNPVLKPASQITISAWIKPENVVAISPEIYRKEDGLNRHLLGFQTTGTMLTLGLNIAGVYNELDVPISAANYTDTWHLVTAVYDGSAMYMYRDGVQIGRTNITGAISTVGTSNAYVGCNHAINEWFKGGIDELSVSGTGRSSNWVWACWQNQKVGSTFLTYESLPVTESAPPSLVFNATYGGSDPSTQEVVVTNRTPLAATWTNATSYGPGASGWLSVTPISGSQEGLAALTHTCAVSIAGLGAGTYTATNVLLSVPSLTPLCHVVVTLSVAKASQTITFPAIPGQLTTNAYGLSASASSALPVSFAVASGPATISGGTNLTFSGAGAVSITASQSGNANWNAAAPVTNSFTVTKAGQAALVFSPSSPQTYGTTNTLSVTGGSGTGVVSYAVQAGPAQIVGGNGLEMLAGIGTVTVVVTRAADAFYNSISATGTVTAAKASQSITFPAIPGQLTTNAYGLSASASSALPVSFAVASGSATISGGTNLTFSGAGAVSITASQSGNANWNAAAPVTNSFTVTKAGQAALVFSPSSPQTYGTTNTLSVTGGSGTGVVSYAVQAGPAQIVGGNGLEMLAGIGTVTVVVTRAADAFYNAISATGVVVASKASQAITFPAIPGQLTTNAYGLSASASSALPVSFAVASGPATISDGTNLTFSGAGTVSITASQSGNANWNAAPPVTNSFTVTRIAQSTLYFTPTSPQPYGTTNVLCTSGGSGTGAVSYAVLSGPGQIVDTCWLTITSGTGTVTVVATKAADAIYSARSVTGLVTASKAGQSIWFAPIEDQWVTNTVRLSASASSGLGVSFAVSSGPATISGGSNLTFSGAGTVRIVASQPGDSGWQQAGSVTNTFRCHTFRVTSLRARQMQDASGKVQIDYTIACHPTTQLASVSMAYSTNAGTAWTPLTAGVMAGDFGANVASGGRSATWNASAEPIRNYNMLMRLVATTGAETVTNVSDRFNLDVLSLNSGLRVRGRICSATTRQPLASADIRLANTNVVGAVLSNGYFDLTNLGIVYGNILTVSNAGYAAISQQIAVPAGAVELAVPTIYLQPLPPGAPVITAVTPEIQGIFVHGVRMDNKFTASVNWNGLVPDRLQFYANGQMIQEWDAPSGTNFTCTINMGGAFSPSFALRANRVEVRVAGHDGTTMEVATNAYTVYTCVIPAPAALSALTSLMNLNVPGECSLNLDIPPDPIDATLWLPVVGKFGLKVGIPVSFAYSIPKGGAWEFKVGGKGSDKSSSSKKGTKLYIGQKEIEVIIQGTASGVADMDRGICVDKLGIHAELNARLQLGWVGLLDVVPGASAVASKIPGGNNVVRQISVGIFVIPGIAGDLVGKLNPTLEFESFEITGKVGVEGSYEPKLGPVEARIYVGGEPSIRVGFPGDFFKYVRFRAYAGAEFKWWIIRLAYENVFVDVQYPPKTAGALAYDGTFPYALASDDGQPQDYVVLHGARNNKLQTLNRDYLRNGVERFSLVPGGAAIAAVPAPGTTPLDAFRALGRTPVRGSVQAAAQPDDKDTPPSSPDGSQTLLLFDSEAQAILTGDGAPPAQAVVEIVENVFPDSSPAMAGVSSNLMLLYVADNGSPNDLQFTDIHWTRYDGWNWSAPTSIVTDTRSEFNPQVRFDGNGDAVAVWERVSDTNFNTLDITAMAAEMEIVWARWDHETGLWTEPVAMTTNTWLDHTPLLAGPLTNGDLMVTWVVNTANLITGTGTVGSAENDTVVWSRWNTATRQWGPSETLVSNIADLNAQTFAAASNTAVYAWSADGDGNQDDDSDVEIFARIFSNDTWLASVRCTSNSVPDKNVRVAVSATGTVHMVWQQESNLVSALNFAPSPNMVRPDSGSVGFSDFAMTYGPLGHMVLLWQEMTTNGSDAHYTVYDPASDVWSRDATLFNDPALERSFAPVWDNIGNLTVAFNAVQIGTTNVEMELEGGGFVTVSNVPQPGTVGLAVVRKALVTDVAILPGDFTVTGANYLPGDAVTLSTVLRNVGDIPVSNALVAFYNGDPAAGGTLISNVVWAGWLEGGATNATCTTVWTVPDPGTNLTFFAVANPAHTITEFTENNNTQSVVAGGTDLSVTLVSAAAETNGSVLVIARVENIGSPGATNTTLAIRRQGESGSPLATVEIPALDPGMTVQTAIDLGPGIQPEGSASYILSADEGGVVADLVTNNDHLAFSVNLWVDSDGDGMPDGWETARGLNPQLASDADGDSDTDGMSNYAEWRAGTHPGDPDSYLSMTGLGLLDAQSPSSGFRLEWGSESNKLYTISRATNLVNGAGFVPLAGNIPATPPVNTYDDTTVGTNSGTFFYRIEVE